MAARRGRPHVERADGAVVLRSPRGRYLSLGAMAHMATILLGSALSMPLASADAVTPAGVAAVGAVVLAGLVGSAWLFASEWRARLRADDAGLERIGVVRRRRVAWADVTRIKYNPNGPWFFLTVADGSHLWLPDSLEGIGDLAQRALARLPPAVLQANPHAREALSELASAP
jgi:hypothetical protein